MCNIYRGGGLIPNQNTIMIMIVLKQQHIMKLRGKYTHTYHLEGLYASNIIICQFVYTIDLLIRLRAPNPYVSIKV